MHLGNISLTIFAVLMTCMFQCLHATAAAIPSPKANTIRATVDKVDAFVSLPPTEENCEPQKLKGRNPQACNMWKRDKA
ncbi:hypothetical protein V8F20_006621 [Naviculisporaceae sp. PSN 640]